VLLAGPQRRPSYLAADLSGLNSSHPEITRDRAGFDGAGANGGAFSCGGWTAVVTAGGTAGGGTAAGGAAAAGDGWLTVSGSGAWLDGLRALCAAAWSAGPPSGDAPEQRRTAEAVLTAIEAAR
jgi:glycerol-1-phosphatase